MAGFETEAQTVLAGISPGSSYEFWLLGGQSQMQRTARFLLWGGFAVLVMSVASCGVGCVAGVATLADEPGADNVLAGAAGVSLLLGIVSIIMLFVGAILKALSPKSRERE